MTFNIEIIYKTIKFSEIISTFSSYKIDYKIKININSYSLLFNKFKFKAFIL